MAVSGKRRTPGPNSWAEFLKRHGETLWGCDFFSVKSVTSKGIRDFYVMVFLCLETREAIVSESTEHPDSEWVCQQTEWFAEQTNDREKKPKLILHDRDVKFTKEFTQTVKDAGMKTNPLPKGSPNVNGRSGTTCRRLVTCQRKWTHSSWISLRSSRMSVGWRIRSSGRRREITDRGPTADRRERERRGCFLPLVMASQSW